MFYKLNILYIYIILIQIFYESIFLYYKYKTNNFYFIKKISYIILIQIFYESIFS